MTDRKRCDWCEKVLQPFVDRDLTDAERQQAQKHLDECEYCKNCYGFEAGLRLLMRQAEPMAPALKQRLSELRLEL